MSSRYFTTIAHIEEKEIAPGFFSRFIHTPNNTINFITVQAGSSIPLHSHLHEQTSMVLEGKFEMTIDNETQVMQPGGYCHIPPQVTHGGTAITDCRLLDIFYPVREDYKML
jgi:quercetin dioxygenase-like cupin family protein